MVFFHSLTLYCSYHPITRRSSIQTVFLFFLVVAFFLLLSFEWKKKHVHDVVRLSDLNKYIFNEIYSNSDCWRWNRKVNVRREIESLIYKYAIATNVIDRVRDVHTAIEQRATNVNFSNLAIFAETKNRKDT